MSWKYKNWGLLLRIIRMLSNYSSNLRAEGFQDIKRANKQAKLYRWPRILKFMFLLCPLNAWSVITFVNSNFFSFNFKAVVNCLFHLLALPIYLLLTLKNKTGLEIAFWKKTKLWAQVFPSTLRSLWPVLSHETQSSGSFKA